LGAGFITREGHDADSVRVGDIDWAAMSMIRDAAGSGTRTQAILTEGEWREMKGLDRGEDPDWVRTWRLLVEGLPEETLLTVIDYHI
jgi:hypothetical protein